MKQTLWAGILMLALGASLIGCGPVTQANTFAGTWTTNLGMMNFVQNDNELIGNMEGYGGFWNETFTGTINENGEAVFETEILGDFTLALDSQSTFKSSSPDLSFCGVRGVDMELPTGCGFSGKWIVPSKHVFLPGSYMVLKQIGDKVTGDLYDENNKIYDSFSGFVDWGKGWRANGTSKQRGELSLWINAVETGFEFIYGDSGNSQQLCAVREGVGSAYLGSFYCEP
ncbi:MAG: hypothetical protein HYU84_01375 [Chloroflexi bacterium]|nr:hypothetical protein [Chloroflexota bacterium]MBI3167500.1 hypothetical protein [Chloroflexota bacterium]